MSSEKMMACPFVLDDPNLTCDGDGESLWEIEIQIVGGHELKATIYGGSAEEVQQLGEQAITAWNARAAVTPPAHGDGLDRFEEGETRVQSRIVIVHQLRASADIQDRQTKVVTGWADTSDRAELMREAANVIERLASHPDTVAGLVSALEALCAGDIDVSGTAIILGNDARTKLADGMFALEAFRAGGAAG